MLRLAATDAVARALREHYALAQRAAGQRLWETPRILSLAQWVADTWVETWPTEQLISGSQALALWHEVITADGRDLLSPLACAREALRAQRLSIVYDLEPERLPRYSDEQRAWYRWYRRVRDRMTEQGWLLREHLDARVAAGLRDGSLPVDGDVELHGFDRSMQTPAARAVLDALARRAPVRPASVSRAVPATPTARSLPDDDSQFRHVATRIRSQLRDSRPDATPRIIVALPDPAGRRERLDGLLVEFVAPWCRLPGDRRGVPWRWEPGRPLPQQPWVEAALAVLHLDARDNGFAALSRLLLSPPLWPGSQRQAAAWLDLQLRETGLPRLHLRSVVAAAPDPIRARLESLLAAISSEPPRAPPGAWAEALERRLGAFQWPAEANLSSAAFQGLRELRVRLARLGGLDTTLGRIDLATARMWLGELLRGGFEPRVEHPQPVLLTTPEDAVGLSCELLIVCDVNTDAFPDRASATPFLALEAQRAAGVPEATPESRLARAQTLADVLRCDAAEVLLLTSAVDERGAELLPSPLFAADWQPANRFGPVSRSEHSAALHTPLRRPDTDPVPAVFDDEAVRGTAGLFSAWFEAPFFAFCTHRLGLRPLPQPGRGLDAGVQGNVLHAALERLWQRLGDRATLLALDDNRMQALVDTALRQPLARFLPRHELGRVLFELERGRARDLLRQWLQHEARRVDDFEVLAREAPLETTLARLPLRLRIDRLDRVLTPLGERYLVLDYKTGREADPRGWEGDRLRDPQLPLYATLAAQVRLQVPQIDGIGFAHLKDGHPALSVATDWCERLIESGTRPKRDWQQRLDAWRTQLESAARGFMAGEAWLDSGALGSDARYGWLLPLAGDDPPDEAAP